MIEAGFFTYVPRLASSYDRRLTCLDCGSQGAPIEAPLMVQSYSPWERYLKGRLISSISDEISKELAT